MLITGTHFFAWGSERTLNQFHCSKCGTRTQFVKKSGMRFIALFFVIPVIPVSGVSKMAQCPKCGTRCEAE